MFTGPTAFQKVHAPGLLHILPPSGRGSVILALTTLGWNLSGSQITKESSETDPESKNSSFLERSLEGVVDRILRCPIGSPPPGVHALNNAWDCKHAGFYSCDQVLLTCILTLTKGDHSRGA